jgi:hypothetical protein
VYRLVYPTLICANLEHASLRRAHGFPRADDQHQSPDDPKYIDVNERHAFVCEQDVVHVFSRESGSEVLRIPADATVRCSQRVEDPFLVSGDWFITPLSVSPKVDESPRPKFIAGVQVHLYSLVHALFTSRIAHVSRDGRDLVVLSEKHRVVFIQDFERICRGETTFERAGLFWAFDQRIYVAILVSSTVVSVWQPFVFHKPPCDCPCSCWFVGSRALYFHLRP